MRLAKLTLGVIGIAAGLALALGPASARIVCNREGDCWHSDDSHARYSNDVHAQYHPDDWYFHQHWDTDRQHHYRDYHEGRGYYRNGEWVNE
jgi:hypothetical protein